MKQAPRFQVVHCDDPSGGYRIFDTATGREITRTYNRLRKPVAAQAARMNAKRRLA